MKYVSVAQIAKKWGVSERTVRNYCAEGKIPEAFLTGKTWNIPEDAQRPDRINKKSDEPKTLPDVLRTEKASGTKGGIYHKVQIELTYNSNHMEGSRLTHDQTRYIYETNTIGVEAGTVKLVGTAYDDVLRETNLLLDDAEHYRSMAEAANPYGDGKACERIIHAILRKNGFDVEILPEFASKA